MVGLAEHDHAILRRFTQRLTGSVRCQCLDELNQVSPLAVADRGHLMMVALGWRQLLRICCGPVI